jgi:hypothetical protein
VVLSELTDEPDEAGAELLVNASSVVCEVSELATPASAEASVVMLLAASSVLALDVLLLPSASLDVRVKLDVPASEAGVSGGVVPPSPGRLKISPRQMFTDGLSEQQIAPSAPSSS